jgi:hypothetical protein
VYDTPKTPGVYLGLFAHATSIYVTGRKECYVLRKLERVPSATETWCERWNMIVNYDGTQAISFSYRLMPPEAVLLLNEQNISFISHEKYLSVIFDNRITWRLHIEVTEANAFRIFIRMYSLFKSERFSANIKVNFHRTLKKSAITHA